MSEWNKNLIPRKTPGANKGGADSIEHYDHIEHIIWQTRTAPPTAYENGLGNALEQVLANTHELSGIVSGLTELGIRAPDGSAFTEESFTQALTRLAAQ